MNGPRENEVAAALQAAGAATVYDAAVGAAGTLRGLRPLWPAVVAGPAFTVSTAPGENLALHRAAAECPAGAVIVASTGGEVEPAVWGEVLTVAALERGAVGLVTDGAVRDVREIRALGFPVFCAGTSPAGAKKGDPGALQVEIRIGGAAVAPGDWVVADEDGIVVVRDEAVGDALVEAERRAESERILFAGLRAGGTTLDLLGLRGEATAQ